MMKYSNVVNVFWAVVLLACFDSLSLSGDETALIQARERLAKAVKQEYAAVKSDEWTKIFLNNLPKQVVEMIAAENCAENVQAFFDQLPKTDKDDILREQNEKAEKLVRSKQKRNTSIKAMLRKKYPLCKVGMKVSVATRRGTVTGVIMRIMKNGVRIDSTFIPKVDMTENDWACFDPVANEIIIEKERNAILKAEKKEFKEMLREELRSCVPKLMLENGYLPKVDENGVCNFQGIKSADWCTRKEFLALFLEWSRMNAVQQRTVALSSEVAALEKQLEQEKKALEKQKKLDDKIRRQADMPCPTCHGSGRVRGKAPRLVVTGGIMNAVTPTGTVIVCPSCGGRGRK